MATRIGAAAASRTLKECLALAKRYGLDAGLPANILARLEVLRDLKELVSAETQGQRITEAMFSHCMAAVAAGDAEGEETPESLQDQAKKAESLAKLLDKKEDPAGARAQRRRAEDLRVRSIVLAAARGTTETKALKLVREWVSAAGVQWSEWAP